MIQCRNIFTGHAALRHSVFRLDDAPRARTGERRVRRCPLPGSVNILQGLPRRSALSRSQVSRQQNSSHPEENNYCFKMLNGLRCFSLFFSAKVLCSPLSASRASRSSLVRSASGDRHLLVTLFIPKAMALATLKSKLLAQ